MGEQQELLNYTLQLADNALIYGHRLSEWCGHGPALEVDMALSNLALDSIGSARSFYQYAAKLDEGDKSEDSYPYLRDVRQFRNVLLVEQLNGDFAHTIARSFYFDAFQELFYDKLKESKDEQLSAIAAKSLKEVSYHYRFSSGWVLKLGDGTAVSKEKMQEGLDDLFVHTSELFIPTELETSMSKLISAPDLSEIKAQWEEKIASIISEAGLNLPEDKKTYHAPGGKAGNHSEHLGFLLAELQFMQRAYPNSEW